MKKLSAKGYEVINKLNGKYNISDFEITDLEEIENFRIGFSMLDQYTCQVTDEDRELFSKFIAQLNS